MCQLTFVKTSLPKITRSFLIGQAFANTTIDFKDGFGFFDGKKVWKTENDPWSFYNWTSFLSESDQAILHVRKAATKYGKNISDSAGSHPFESENFILAHNGVLELKETSKFKEENFKDKIDSQIFLDVLQETYKEKGDFLVAIKDSVNNFWGKFAFLIFEKSTGNYYAVRGETATLFFTYISIIKKDWTAVGNGYVINTEKSSLEKGLIVSASHFPRELYLDYVALKDKTVEKAGELEKNSIYLLGDEIKKIGDVKETRKEYTWADPKYYWKGYNTAKEIPNKKEIETIINFMFKWAISFFYLDLICIMSLGVGILYLSDYSKLVLILQDIDKISGNPNKKRNLWKIKTQNDYMNIHRKIEFPYMVNTEKEILEAVK